MTNILGLTNQEVLMRARADLRLGVPIVLAGSKIDVVVAAIDVLRQSRLDQLKSIDENVAPSKFACLKFTLLRFVFTKSAFLKSA